MGIKQILNKVLVECTANIVGIVCRSSSRSLFGKDNSGSEEMRYCSRCGKTTLHSHISEYELKCKECGNVTEED